MYKNTVNILNFIVYAFLKTVYQVDHYIFKLYIRKCDITFKFILLNKNFSALFFVNQSMKTHAKNRQLIKKSPNANKIHKGNHTLKFIIIAISCKLSKLKH